MFEIRLLGQFDLRRDGDAVEIPSRPAQSLLAYLSLSAGIAHRREKLSGLLWPDASEANARSNLRHALWRIRQALSSPQGTPPSFLVADNISIAFHSDPDARVDAAVLDRPYDQRRPLHELVESVAAYGGELLPGFYDDWVILERERLRATLERKMQALLDRLRSEGRWAEVIEWGERWIALGHVPEPAYRALMEAHSSLGDPAGASAAYQRCVGSLRRELDVEPSEQTRSLHQQLSAGRKPPLPRAEPARPEHVDSPRAAVLALLERWHREDVDVLDLASLALVHAAQSNEPLDPPDVRLLIRSAVHHEVDLEPWLRHAGSPQVAAAALDEALRAYPKPQARMRIVQALRGLEGREAEEVLFRVATNDDAARVRSLAAVAVAERAGSEGVACALVDEVNATGGSAAMAALVAVADEIGLPKDLAPYPKVSLGVALGQRRWKTHREAIFRRMRKGALGGAIAMVLVANVQLVPGVILNPGVMQGTLAFMSLPLWLLSNTILGVLWGGILGASIGFTSALADALWTDSARTRVRLLLAALAGLVHAFFYILLSLSGGFSPSATASIYVPVYLLYGLSIGATLSSVVPQLHSTSSSRALWRKVAMTTGMVAILSVPTDRLIYGDEFLIAIILDLLFALFFPIGLALAFRKRREALS